MCELQIFKSWSGPATPIAASNPAEILFSVNSPAHYQQQVWSPLIDEGSSAIPYAGFQPVGTQLADALEPTCSPQYSLLASHDQLTVRDEYHFVSPSVITPHSDKSLSAFVTAADQSEETSSPSASYDALFPFTHSVSEALNQFSSPALLYCPVPWPDDLLASPRRQFLWQYFLYSVESHALCLDWEDLSLVPGFQDPFLATLPQMALTNSALRSAVMCFSMFQYFSGSCQQNSQQLLLLAWNEACRGLQLQLAHLQEDDSCGILILISASCLLHWCAPARKDDYLQLAAKLAATFLKRSRSSITIPASSRDLILTSFRWTAISALCSLRPPRSLLNDEVRRVLELDHNEIGQNFSPSFQGWISHPIYAFSLQLINPLLRIGQLTEIQLSRGCSNGEEAEEDSDGPWDQKVAELEEMLLSAREVDLEAISTPGRAGDPVAVASLNEAMHAASVILFYTRFRGMPFTAPLIRKQVRVVVNEICKTRMCSRVSFAAVFPLFAAGCEAVDIDARDIIRQRLLAPKGLFFDRGDLIAALHHIWELRDSEPGLVWPQWVNKGKDVIGLNLFLSFYAYSWIIECAFRPNTLC